MRAIVGAVAVVVVLATSAGAARGDVFVSWPDDGMPAWSPDGTRIMFVTTREGRGLAVAAADGSSERTILGDVVRAVPSPDWSWIAFTREPPGARTTVWTARADGSDARRISESWGERPAWSPDSTRIAFAAADGLWLFDRDGGNPVRLAPAGFSPAWSPDGSRIVFVVERHLLVAPSAGGAPTLVASVPGERVEPQWSPDGSLIAFLAYVDARPFPYYRIGVVRPDGSALRVFPEAQVSFTDGEYSWMPDSRRLVYGGAYPEQGLYLLDLRSGRTSRLTQEGTSPSPSPDGDRIAFVADGECLDRRGIRVASADGKLVRRLTNDCRIFGTPGDDELRGTLYLDVLLGLGGDDRLFSMPGRFYGDVLAGGSGEDLLVGDLLKDRLDGGPGSDRLSGGMGRDVLIGGRGRDRIDGGNGWDEVKARDGERDTIVCGTKSAGARENDRVWADRQDRVARDCELVYRPRG